MDDAKNNSRVEYFRNRRKAQKKTQEDVRKLVLLFNVICVMVMIVLLM